MKKLFTLGTILTLMFSLTSVVVSASKMDPKILIKPEKAVYGTPYSFKITGLNAMEKVLIKAVAVDKLNIRWESQVSFKADENGEIDLEKLVPVSGNYKKKDQFGLLWSMKPVNSKRPETVFMYDYEKGLKIKFYLKDSSGKTISKELYRYYEDPKNKLKTIKLEKDGLKGTLYSPKTSKKYPGVLVLGGSNGGSINYLAKAIAYHGYSVLDLPYFKYPGLPKKMINIPIEYFHKAIGWIRKQKSVKEGKIGLIGGSRGGELVLLLGSMFNEFNAIIGWVPAAHLWQGEEFSKIVPTWTYKGTSLPYLGGMMSKEDMKKLFSGQLTSFREYFFKSLKTLDKDLIKRSQIKVEKIKAPILLISGKVDQTWPSTEFSEMIIDRLKKNNFKYDYKHFAAEGAGHQVFLPDFITATYRGFNGGSREAELHQSIRSWKETIDFLKKYLD